MSDVKDIDKAILEDAIYHYIRAEKRILYLKRVIIALTISVIALAIGYVGYLF